LFAGGIWPLHFAYLMVFADGPRVASGGPALVASPKRIRFGAPDGSFQSPDLAAAKRVAGAKAHDIVRPAVSLHATRRKTLRAYSGEDNIKIGPRFTPDVVSTTLENVDGQREGSARGPNILARRGTGTSSLVSMWLLPCCLTTPTCITNADLFLRFRVEGSNAAIGDSSLLGPRPRSGRDGTAGTVLPRAEDPKFETGIRRPSP